MGAPLPIYYHKIFNYIASIFFLIIGHMKASIMCSMVVINAVGSYGVYKCTRQLGVNKLSSFFLGCTLLFLHYSITDWFIRGAFAEYTAMMILPWLFLWIISFLKTKKMSWVIIVVIFLLFHSHNVIAYYSIFALIIALLLVMIEQRSLSFSFYCLRKGSLYSMIFIVINLFYIFPLWKLKAFYDPSKLKIDISKEFKPLSYLFRDSNYRWLRTWEGFTVNIGFFFMCFVLLSLTLLLFHLISKKDLGVSRVVVWFLCICLVFFVSLTTRFFNFFYDFVPFADFIQFPWRLNTFIQVIGILVLAIIPIPKKTVLFGILLGVYVCFYPLLGEINSSWGWLKNVEDRVNKGVYGTAGEYMPDVDVSFDSEDFFNELRLRGVEFSDSLSICNQKKETNPEQLILQYSLDIKTNTEIVLPHNYSGLEKFKVMKNGEESFLQAYRTSTDPRMRFKLQIGQYNATLYLPQVSNYLRY